MEELYSDNEKGFNSYVDMRKITITTPANTFDIRISGNSKFCSIFICAEDLISPLFTHINMEWALRDSDKLELRDIVETHHTDEYINVGKSIIELDDEELFSIYISIFDCSLILSRSKKSSLSKFIMDVFFKYIKYIRKLEIEQEIPRKVEKIKHNIENHRIDIDRIKQFLSGNQTEN